jgi:hypothetical protein
MIELQWYSWFVLVVLSMSFGGYLGYRVGWSGGFHEAQRHIRIQNLFGSKTSKEKKE